MKDYNTNLINSENNNKKIGIISIRKTSIIKEFTSLPFLSCLLAKHQGFGR